MRRSQRIVPCPLSIDKLVSGSFRSRQEDDTVKLSPAAAPPSFNDAAADYATMAGWELARSSLALHATIAVCARWLRDGDNNIRWRVGWLSA